MKKIICKRWGVITASLLNLLLVACANNPGDSVNREHLSKAQALFAQRCQNAGEKIFRTAVDVEGLFLMKLRPAYVNYGNQFELDDPYGLDLIGDGYIESFLRGQFAATHEGGEKLSPIGYLYVEAIDPKDGGRYRYTGEIEEPWQKNKSYLKGYLRFALNKKISASGRPRYGVTYDDISTSEDRKYWIAGSSLRVVDLLTGELMAERVGYMMDPLQGNSSGGRAPWLLALNNACPGFGSGRNSGHASAATPYQTVRFVEKTLKLKN